MKKRIALALSLALGITLGIASPAQAAPVPAAVPSSYCITMAGALTCIGTVPPPTYLQAPVKRIPERQAQKAMVAELARQAIAANKARRLAALQSRIALSR